MAGQSPGAQALDDAVPVGQPVIYGLPLDDGVPRLVLFVPEVAALLRVSNDVVYSLIRSGQLRVRNLHPGSRNSRYLVPVSSLLDYLRGHDDPIPPAD